MAVVQGILSAEDLTRAREVAAPASDGRRRSVSELLGGGSPAASVWGVHTSESPRGVPAMPQEEGRVRDGQVIAGDGGGSIYTRARRGVVPA